MQVDAPADEHVSWRPSAAQARREGRPSNAVLAIRTWVGDRPAALKRATKLEAGGYLIVGRDRLELR